MQDFLEYGFVHAESCPFVPGQNKSKPEVPCDNEQDYIWFI